VSAGKSPACAARFGTTALTRTARQDGRGALWAPDADAFLCDEHALGGATMTLLYEPDGSSKTTVRVIEARHIEPMSVPIKKMERP
jgi:hypothetical protein